MEEEMIDFRKKFIKIMNETLGDICFYVLYLQEFMISLTKIRNKSKLKDKSISLKSLVHKSVFSPCAASCSSTIS